MLNESKKEEVKLWWEEGNGLTVEELQETCRALPRSNSPLTWLWCKASSPSSPTHHSPPPPLTENSKCWSSCSATNNIDSLSTHPSA